MDSETRKRFSQLNAAWLAGERVDGLQFLYNSMVKVTLPDGATKTGWIVAAMLDGPEPIYTLETLDGSGDVECPESALMRVEG